MSHPLMSVPSLIPSNSTLSPSHAAPPPSISSVAAAGAVAPPSAPPHKFDHLTFVIQIDIVILAFFVFFSLLTLPRLFARYSRKSEWPLGNIMYAGPSTGLGARWKRNASSASIPDSVYRTAVENGSEVSITACSHTDLVVQGQENRQNSRSNQSRSRIHSITTVLGHPIITGYSVGKLLILFGYSAIVIFASIYLSNPFNDPVRTGFVAMAQMPIVFALATKNNILGVLLARGYEKMNYLHQFAGLLTAIVGNIHVIGYFYKWSYAGTLKHNLMDQQYIFGLVSLLGLNLLVFFSTGFWRQKCYNIFMFSHIFGFILFPVGLCFHEPIAIPWVIATASIYALDHIMRLFKTRITNATLRPMTDLGITRIEVPRINKGWRAGQHVRVRVFSTGMGALGWSEVHPFTIASVGGDSMLLMCKKVGGWTNKLYDIASGGDTTEKGMTTGRNAMVLLEGPYGGLGHVLMDRYSGAVFITGGSGITFALACIQELLQKDIAGQSNVKVIELVWCVQTAASLMSMLPQFASFVQQAPFTRVHVSVYYTRSSMSADPNKLYGYLPPNVVLTPGRPKMTPIINSVIDQTCNTVQNTTGCFVGVCGPLSLGEQVRTAVGEVSSDRRDLVGGIELCEEIFGW